MYVLYLSEDVVLESIPSGSQETQSALQYGAYERRGAQNYVSQMGKNNLMVKQQ